MASYKLKPVAVKMGGGLKNILLQPCGHGQHLGGGTWFKGIADTEITPHLA